MTDSAVLYVEAQNRVLEGLFLTEKQYLATEPERAERHEYSDGQKGNKGSGNET